MKQSPHEHSSSASLSPAEESAAPPSPQVLDASFAGPAHTEVPLPGRFVLVDATIPDAQLLIAHYQPLEGYFPRREKSSRSQALAASPSLNR